MIYGYVRVAAFDVENGGEFAALQVKDIKREYPDSNVIIEECELLSERHILNALIDKLTEGDVIVVSNIDRLFRGYIEALEIVKKIRKKGATIVLLDLGKIDDSLDGETTMAYLTEQAEFEHQTRENYKFWLEHRNKIKVDN